MLGVISVGLFASPKRMEEAFGLANHVGLFYSWGRGSGDATLLSVQLIAVLWIIGWVFGVMGPYIWVLNSMGMLRVCSLEEDVGEDIARHGGLAYEIIIVDDNKIEEFMTQRRLENLGSPRSPIRVLKAVDPSPA